MKNLPLIIVFCVFSIFSFTSSASVQNPATTATDNPTPGKYTDSIDYKNPGLPVNARVKDLLSRMTPEEKFWQLFMLTEDLSRDKSKYQKGVFGFQGGLSMDPTERDKLNIPPALRGDARELTLRMNEIQRYFVEKTRLGIPVIFFEEALHGLCKKGATIFPQSIGLAATFDTGLMHRVAGAIAKETRRQGIRQILSPVVNVATDPRWGRTEETYGEDPFLCSEMGVSYITEFEHAGVIATPKHFVANSGDGGRDSYPVNANERLLENLYFPPFKACISRGGAGSVMTAYNSLDGRPCSSNEWLLRKKLKGDWKFEGFVISDAGATGGANLLHKTALDYPDAGIQAMKNGQDVLFQTDFDHATLFLPAYLDGRIPGKDIDSAVARVLRAKFKLGLFDNPYCDPEPGTSYDNPGLNKELALEAAEKAIVLLKNKDQLLPLSGAYTRIAVIGPEAVEARTGGYSGPSSEKVSILDGIKKRFGDPAVVRYEPGCGRSPVTYITVPSNCLMPSPADGALHGLQGEYFNSRDISGNPVLVRTDPEISFRWALYQPGPGINYDWYSIRWTGFLHSPVTGSVKIGIEGNDGYRLYLDDSLLIDNWNKKSFASTLVDYRFEKNRKYSIRIEYFETTGSGRMRLIWNAGVIDEWENEIQKAVDLVNQSDVAIVTVGIEEGEGRDRAFLGLPGHQEELINKVAATGKPVVVILVGGSAITMNSWLMNVSSVLDVWYPGERGGDAVARVLAGDYNPAGRLPIAFPMAEGQLPLLYNHLPTGRSDDYTDLTGEALFPFGYGLSYTNFDYQDPLLAKPRIHPDDSTTLSFTIKNTGKFPGDEVVQLYIQDVLSSVARPARELKGFTRIHLGPGESKKVEFRITPSLLAMVDQEMEHVVEPGEFRLLIGTSSKDIRLREILTVIKPVADESYIWPSEPGVLNNLKLWQGYKFGIIIHFGLYSQLGDIESWGLCPEDWVERKGFDDYFAYATHYRNTKAIFNPVDFNPAKWAKTIHGSGARYVIFTTKHHDGFCLFDSQFTDFKTTDKGCPYSVNRNADLAKAAFDAFRNEGLAVGAYFSKPDWTTPYFWWPANPPKDRNPNYDITRHPDRWKKYVDYTRQQINEITSDYGKLDILWLDGCWVLPFSSITPKIAEYCKYPYDMDLDMKTIAQRARTKQPGMLVVDRWVGGPYENYLTPEQKIPEKALAIPWESCITMGNAWGWVPGDQYKPAKELIQLLVKIVAKGGNLLLGIGPNGAGEFEPAVYDRLSSMGKWLRENGEAIYGTVPVEPYQDGKIAYTAKGDQTIYAIYLPDPDEKEIPAQIGLLIDLPGKIKVSLLALNKRLQGKRLKGHLVISVPPGLRKSLAASEAVVIKISAESRSK